MTPRFLVLCAALVVAGCVGDPVEPANQKPDPTPPTGDDVEPDLPEATLPPFNVTQFNGSVAGVGSGEAGYFRVAGDNVFAFDVPEGVTAIVVEVAWSGSDALDVRVDVPAEHCEPVDPVGLLGTCPSPPPDAEGASPARIEVTDPEALKRVGEWSLGAWARASPNEVPFVAAVTLFHGEKPANGYSGLPPA